MSSSETSSDAALPEGASAGVSAFPSFGASSFEGTLGAEGAGEGEATGVNSSPPLSKFLEVRMIISSMTISVVCF